MKQFKILLEGNYTKEIGIRTIMGKNKKDIIKKAKGVYPYCKIKGVLNG